MKSRSVQDTVEEGSNNTERGRQASQPAPPASDESRPESRWESALGALGQGGSDFTLEVSQELISVRLENLLRRPALPGVLVPGCLDPSGLCCPLLCFQE